MTGRLHKQPPWLRLSVLIVMFAVMITGSFLLANKINETTLARELVGHYGYIAILVVAVIAGLNAIVPVPAATFVPVFTEAGLFLPIIVLLLIIGTTIADLIGFAFGSLSRQHIEREYPRLIRLIRALHDRHHLLVVPTIIAYAAVIPLPNEVLVIPLALLGVRFQTLLLPLLIGNSINQAALAYGFDSIFSVFF